MIKNIFVTLEIIEDKSKRKVKKKKGDKLHACSTLEVSAWDQI